MGIFSGISKYLFGGKGKSTQQSTTDATRHEIVAPYAPVAPSIQTLIGDLDTLYGPNGAPQIGAMEQGGYDALARTAAASPATDAAISESNAVLSGKYLNPDTNPYLADIAKRVSGSAMKAINATFGGGGRTGSGLHAMNAARGVGDAVGDLYYQNYNAERGRMDTAAGRASQLEASRYLAPQALIEGGKQISARPYDIAAQRTGVLSNIARLGQATDSTGSTNMVGKGTNAPAQSGIVPSFINKLLLG